MYEVIIIWGKRCLPPHAPTGEHVLLKVYKQNLQALITHPAVVAHLPKTILVTLTPIDEIQQREVDAMRGYPLCRRADVTAEYAEAARQVGEENGGDLLVIDLWSAVMAEAIRGTPNHDPKGPVLGSKQLGSNEALEGLVPDGPHFGSAGYSIFYKVLPMADFFQVRLPRLATGTQSRMKTRE